MCPCLSCESEPIESSFSDNVSHLRFDLARCRVLKHNYEYTQIEERIKRVGEPQEEKSLTPWIRINI